MALVPIRCPSCGASVDLEEGQTIVRCAYCESTSYLPKPAEPPHPAPRPVAPAPKPTSRASLFVVLAVGALMFGGLGYFLSKGGVGADYLKDATAVREVLTDGLGAKTRFVTMTLTGGFTYVEVLEGDGTVVVHRFDGGHPRSPTASGKVDDIALARKGAFTLDDVDFAVVSKIVAHAQKQVPKGKPQHVIFERKPPHQADLLWTVAIDVAGEHQQFYYTPAGKALVEEPIDFIAAFARAAMSLFEEKLRDDARVVAVQLTRESAMVEVMAAKSQRDTDRYTFWAGGVVSAPVPQTTDGDAAQLAAKIFVLKDLDGAAVEKAVADATKQLGGQVNMVQIHRVKGELGIFVYAKGDRGTTRNLSYDAKGKRLPP